MKTDIQIAQEAEMKHISVISKSIHVSDDDVSFYGKYKAKINHRLLKKMENQYC